MVRRCIHFFAIGAVLVALDVVSCSAPTRVAVVRVPAAANEQAVREAIDNAILLEEARRYGWHKSDPVVFQHLVRNMKFVEQDESTDAFTLFDRAIDLGMDRTDPVVRSRLLHRARKSLAFVPKDQEPSDEELLAHVQKYPTRFARPPQVRFTHVFVSKDRRGTALYTDAQRIFGELQQTALSPKEAHRLGDALLGAKPSEVGSVDTFSRAYGPEFASSLDQASLGKWAGPFKSVYGLHLVQVTERGKAEPPPLDEIRNQVRGDFIRDLGERLAKDRLASLRNAYEVQVEQTP